MSSTYEKAVQPLIAKLYSSTTEGELIENFRELKALLTSILESEETEADAIITAFYALLEMAKVQAISIARMKSQIAELEKGIRK